MQSVPPDFVILVQQDAQLSQRDRAAGCVIAFAKSRRLELGDNILLLIDRAIRRNWVMLDSLVEKYRMTSNISCDWFVRLSAANQNDPAQRRLLAANIAY